jgi:hypothetical protein
MTDPNNPIDRDIPRRNLSQLQDFLDTEEAKEAALELNYPQVIVILNSKEPDLVFLVGPYDNPADAFTQVEFYRECDKRPGAIANHEVTGYPRYIIRPLQPHDS